MVDACKSIAIKPGKGLRGDSFTQPSMMTDLDSRLETSHECRHGYVALLDPSNTQLHSTVVSSLHAVHSNVRPKCTHLCSTVIPKYSQAIYVALSDLSTLDLHSTVRPEFYTAKYIALSNLNTTKLHSNQLLHSFIACSDPSTTQFIH